MLNKKIMHMHCCCKQILNRRKGFSCGWRMAAEQDLCFIINNRTVLDVNYSSEIVYCLIALAYACDQRFGGNTVSAASMELARQTLANLNRNYSTEVMMRLAKAAGVAYKMLDGESLSEDEEEFLLKKLEI